MQLGGIADGEWSVSERFTQKGINENPYNFTGGLL